MVEGKLSRENEKGNFFGVCLVGWGGRKINSVFSLSSPKSSPQNGEKTRRGRLMK